MNRIEGAKVAGKVQLADLAGNVRPNGWSDHHRARSNIPDNRYQQTSMPGKN
ncbi:MAG: hypothetical protein AAF670_09445 [Planctomycetota bacterium]